MKNFNYFVIKRASGLRAIFLTALLIAFIGVARAQVGVGTTTPHASAQLDVDSDEKGFLMPRMTAAQRTDIDSPAQGLLVYQTDGKNGFYFYDGSVWRLLVPETSQIGFSATANLEDVVGDRVISNYSTLYNDEGGFNAGTGVYTVPTTGVYRVSAVINYTTTSAIFSSLFPDIDPRMVLRVNGGAELTGLFPLIDLVLISTIIRGLLGSGTVVIAGDIPLTAGDEVDLQYVSDGMTVSLNFGSEKAKGVVWSMQKL